MNFLFPCEYRRNEKFTQEKFKPHREYRIDRKPTTFHGTISKRDKCEIIVECALTLLCRHRVKRVCFLHRILVTFLLPSNYFPEYCSTRQFSFSDNRDYLVMPKQQQSTRRQNLGFTLIEILVVVAVIGILAAILFPVLARTRENARRASCQSNLRQIGLGLQQYLQDYDGTYPNVSFGSSGLGAPYQYVGAYRWMDAIYPYTKSEQLFVCPSANAFKYKLRTLDEYGGYAYNGAYFTAATPTVPDTKTPPCSKWDKGYGVKDAQNEVPTQTIWVSEGNGNFEISWSETVDPEINAGEPRTFGPYGLTDMIVERHLRTVGVLWCDGHVKAQQLEDIVRKNDDGTRRFFTIQDD